MAKLRNRRVGLEKFSARRFGCLHCLHLLSPAHALRNIPTSHSSSDSLCHDANPRSEFFEEF